MNTLRLLWRRLTAALRRSRRDAEMDAELRAHLDALTQENIRRGMPAQEARYAARREFGGLEQVKEAHREQRGLPMLDALAQDLRFAVRMLRKRPGFALVAILTLALGIGATTAVFSVVDRLLFRSLPYPEDQQLVSFGDKAPFESVEFVLGPDYLDWREQQTPFSSVTSMVPGTRDCDVTERNPMRLACAAVDSSFLPTLGIAPLFGRNFTAQEDRPNAPGVALLSYGYWSSRYARDAGVIGKTVAVDDREVQIIGVLPAGFELPNLAHFDLLVPEALDTSRDRGPNARQVILRAFGRMKPGVTVAGAAAAMQPLFEESLGHVPPQFRKEVSFRLRPLRDLQVGDARRASWIFLGAVLGVLLLACTNVAGLLFARASQRGRELAVRRALGATRLRLVRQALTESVLLAILGGAAGVILAQWLIRFFVTIAPAGIPRLEQAGVDGRILVFTTLVSVLSGIFFGLMPALQQPAPAALAGKDVPAANRARARQFLVALQMAVSFVLLAGAGLLIRTLQKLESVPLGMNAERVLTAQISLNPSRYPNAAQQMAFFNELAARLRGFPGVPAVAISDSLPPSGRSRATFLSAIEVAGHGKFAEGTGGMVGWRMVSPDYFDALGIRITRGRTFSSGDASLAALPVIVNQALAQRILPGEDPVGKMFRFASGPWRRVVGVAANVKNNGLAAAAGPEFYVLWKEDPQEFYASAYVAIRGYGSTDALPRWVRAQVAALDPTLPVTEEEMNSRIVKLAARPKFNAMLLALFAGLGVLLAAIGLYGLVGFLVVQRTAEIGVRMAMGATPGGILRLILAGVSRWTTAGMLLGALGAWFATRLLASLLFEVEPHDPWLMSIAVGLLCAVALAAAWIPARRAARVDPAVALRYE